MKLFYLFLGLFLLTSPAVSHSAQAGSLVPAGLTSAIEHVKNMKHSGASKKDIAAYVTKTVANRVTFLNHASERWKSLRGDADIKKQLQRFDAFWDQGNLAADEFSAAAWVWVNRIGQCNESASTAFHILVMAYESVSEITTVSKGDHRFVILGDVKNIPNPFSADDLRKLDNTYIVDPWDGVSFSTKDLSFFDWYQHGNGNVINTRKYKFYKKKYNNWLTWCKKNPVKYQKWLYGLSEKEAEEKVEHEDSMNFQLDQYRKEINDLITLKEQILQKGRASLRKAKYNIRSVRAIQSELKQYKILIYSLVDHGDKFCDESRLLHQKIITLSAAVEDGEAIINSKIDLARERKANCKTDADTVFVKSNYQAAQEALAIMKTSKEAAFETLVNINLKRERIKKNNDALSKLYNDKWWKEQKRELDEISEAIPPFLDQLETGLKDAKNLALKRKDLKKKIEDTKQFYIQYFPASKADFDKLIKEVSSINLYYVISTAELDDLKQEYQTAQTVSDTIMEDNSRLLRGGPPLVSCFSDKASKKEMDKIDEAFLRGLLVLKTSDYLRDGCQVVTADHDPAKDSDDSSAQPPVADDGAAPATPDAGSGNGTGQSTSSNSMGGLIISGPAKLVAGQGVAYTACDATGTPYRLGSFSWGISDESIMSLGKSGNPVTGSGFKAGTVTIFVHYDGGDIYSGTAWLDVKIRDKKNNLFSTSGGENSENIGNDQGDLFSSSGGEQISDGSSLFSSAGGENNQAGTPGQNGEKNKLKNKCTQLLNNISSALGSGDTDSAQSFTNQAAALGCDIDPMVLAQVENIEKEKKEQREQQLADIAREKKRQKEACRKIRLDILAAINQKNVGALQNLAGIAANAGCNTNISGINQIIAGIKEEKRQQQAQQHAQNNRPRKPQNRTNWMDVMNAIVKGVKDVQRDHTKPSGRGSKPLPSAGSVWQSHHPSVDTQTNNGNKEYNRVLDMCRKGLTGMSMAYAKNRFKGLTCEEIANYRGYGICPTWAINCKDKKRYQAGSGNTAGSPNYNKNNGPTCPGHTLDCDHGWGRNFSAAIDSNRDGICDVCGRPIKGSQTKSIGVIKDKDVTCREVTK